MTANPFLIGELLAKNIIAFAAEGLVYLEPQINSFGYRTPGGSQISPQEVVNFFSQRIQQQDVVETGVTVRFQQSILRFLPEAEDALKSAYEVVSKNDLYVAVNMVGREDNDKGHPLRFLSTLRDLRRSYSGVRLSIHGGEVDEPNFHVRLNSFTATKNSSVMVESHIPRSSVDNATGIPVLKYSGKG